mmetsp:Transcript_88033/g.235504  ORF Transcript_88033/g.235504 Transcript_88033/m.235504 type:complete len:714 (-) Transcript_88033:97-2238(-)
MTSLSWGGCVNACTQSKSAVDVSEYDAIVPDASQQWETVMDLANGNSHVPRRGVSGSWLEDDEAIPEEVVSQRNVDASWFNIFLVELWPYISGTLHKILNNKVLATLRGKIMEHAEAMRRFGVDVDKLNAIGFEKCDLGDAPAALKNLEICRRLLANNEKVLQIDGSLVYQGETDIVVNAILFKLPITKITFRGHFSVLLRPLIGEKPIVAGAQIFFMDVPEIDYEFGVEGAGAALSSLVSIMKASLKETIAREVSNQFVMPNRKLIQQQVSDEVEQTIDWGDISHPMPEGVLRVRLARGRDLVASDLAIFGEATSDPYGKIMLGSQVVKTSTVSQSCDPDWPVGECYDLTIFSFRQVLKIEIFDHDMLSADDFLGKTQPISIAQLFTAADTTDGRMYSIWLHLDVEGVEGGEGHAGKSRVELNLQFFTLTSAFPKTERELIANKENTVDDVMTERVGLLPTLASNPKTPGPITPILRTPPTSQPGLCGVFTNRCSGEGHKEPDEIRVLGRAEMPVALLAVDFHGVRGLPIEELRSLKVRMTISGGLGDVDKVVRNSKACQITKPRIHFNQPIADSLQQVVCQLVLDEGFQAAEVARLTELDPATVDQILRAHFHFFGQWGQAIHEFLCSPVDAVVHFALLKEKEEIGSAELPLQRVLLEDAMTLREILSMSLKPTVVKRIQAKLTEDKAIHVEMSLTVKCRYFKRRAYQVPH